MRRLCGGYAEVMRGLCGYATENLQIRKNLHSTHLCRGYAEVMRRFLFCGGCVEQFPMRRFGGLGSLGDALRGPWMTVLSLRSGGLAQRLINRTQFKAQPRAKHNQGQSTTKDKAQPRTKHNQGDMRNMSPVHSLRSPRASHPRDSTFYTVLQGFCASLMSNADQQPLQKASITLDWRVTGQGNRRQFKAQPRTKHNPSKHNQGPSTNQARTKHNQGDACKISPAHNLRSPRKKTRRLHCAARLLRKSNV